MSARPGTRGGRHGIVRMIGPGAGAVLLTMLCTSPTPARARARIVDSDPVVQAAAEAVSYWGSPPCGGAVAVVGGSPREAPVAGRNTPGVSLARAAMWASWMTPLGANTFAAPAASFTDCTVHINLLIWPDWLTDDMNFRAFCKEMVHEYGHFEGHPDTGALIGTVEYEQPEYAKVPGCAHFRLIYGHRVFRPVPVGRFRPPQRRRGRRMR